MNTSESVIKLLRPKIYNILPHTGLMALLEEVEIDGHTAIAIAKLPEEIFQAHFQIFPGVLILESVAQCASLLAYQFIKQESSLPLLIGTDFRWKGVVDQPIVKVSATLEKNKAGFFIFSGEATFAEKVVASGKITGYCKKN